MQEQMASELKGKWVGPMPVARFLDTFLPTEVDDYDLPLTKESYFNELETYADENQMYEPFVSS